MILLCIGEYDFCIAEFVIFFVLQPFLSRLALGVANCRSKFTVILPTRAKFSWVESLGTSPKVGS